LSVFDEFFTLVHRYRR